MRFRRITTACATAVVASVAHGCRANPGASARVSSSPAIAPSVVASLQHSLDSLRGAGQFPGVTLGVTFADGRSIALASGESDTARHIPMRPTDRMLQGSVGKTYVAAVAMQLVAEGKLDLDAKIERYLGHEPWFDRLPNAHDITVRELMRHTSGLVRYEFQPAATAALRADPFKTWTPEDRLAFIFDTRAPFAAGKGWEYSDTNYIVLGMILERLLGEPYYTALEKRVLVPLGLSNTIPSNTPELPGVVNGYAGPNNDLGGYDASMRDGRLRVNPQFEWTGGGIASTADDLSRWARLLYEGRAFDPKLLPTMLDAVPARLGPNTAYGLGVIVRQTPDGPVWGHSGFFPGYATEMLYNPATHVAAAIQVNITQPYPRGLVPFLVAVTKLGGDSR
jgi:D-alanyl-D-alanine carboxypeptidase